MPDYGKETTLGYHAGGVEGLAINEARRAREACDAPAQLSSNLYEMRDRLWSYNRRLETSISRLRDKNIQMFLKPGSTPTPEEASNSGRAPTSLIGELNDVIIEMSRRLEVLEAEISIIETI